MMTVSPERSRSAMGFTSRVKPPIKNTAAHPRLSMVFSVV